MVIKMPRPNLAEYQERMLYCPERNSICEATTKAGKTASHMWWLMEKAHQAKKPGCNYWWVAPIRSQAKIAFDRIRRSLPPGDWYKINLTDLTITTPLESIIWFKSADNPDSLYGEDVHAAVLDEVSRMREESFFAVRSTLTATKGPMKLIGNVKGTAGWSYQLARKVEAKQVPDWAYFKITADDAVRAGILEQAEIDAARAIYPSGIFLELYYGIPFVNSSNKFAYAFDPAKHVGSCRVNPKYPVYVSFDFNRNPITCILVQHYNGCIYVPKAFKLPNSDIYKLCAALWSYLLGNGIERDQIIVNGDATGRNSSAMVRDNLNYFRIILSELKLQKSQMQQAANNPPVEENQVLVNAMLEHVKTQIDPDEAGSLISDLQFVEMLPDGSIKKGDRNDPNQQADQIDCLRYYYHRNWNRAMLKGQLPNVSTAVHNPSALAVSNN